MLPKLREIHATKGIIFTAIIALQISLTYLREVIAALLITPRMESIGKESEENRNSFKQVLNHENWNVVSVVNENNCSITTDECVSTGGNTSNKEQLFYTSPCNDAAQVNALTINDRNRESGYFSNDQSQDDTLTGLSEKEPRGHELCVPKNMMLDDDLSVKRGISNEDETSQRCHALSSVSHFENKNNAVKNPHLVISNENSDETFSIGTTLQNTIISTANLQNKTFKNNLWRNDDDRMQNPISFCDLVAPEQQLDFALDLSNSEIENESVPDKIEICKNYSRLSNKNKTSENSGSSYNEANDKNQISSLESQRVTSENLFEDSLHHDQTVCGQSNQIKVDKHIEDLKETSNFSDKHYGLSCTNGINRCQKCFKNLHTSEKFNTYGQNIKEEDLQNLCGCLCIEQEYCDHVLDLCSENSIQEQISCSEASPKTSNVCYKSANCIYDISKDKTDDRTRSDLITPGTFETKQEEEGCVKDICYSKQNDEDFSQHDFHLKNNAISISNGENCESFCDPIRVLPGRYTSVSDCKNVENHLAKSKFTDSSHAFGNKRSYSDSDIYARCLCLSDNSIQRKLSCKSKDDSVLHGLDHENVNFFQEYTEKCDSSCPSQRGDIVPYLQESHTCCCEDKGVCPDLTASSYDNNSESSILNATGVLINSSEQVDISDISPYCSLPQQTGVSPIIKSAKYRSETGVNCSINCQACSITCFENVSSNEPTSSSGQINDNKKHAISNIADPEISCKNVFYQKRLARDQNVGSELCKPNLITCEGGESLSDFISDEELYLHETSDTFVDAEDNFADSDTDEINNFNESTPNRCSLLYTGSEQSTSVDSFQDAIDYFDYESDNTHDDFENTLNIDLCDRYKQVSICENCHSVIYDDRLLQNSENCFAVSKQNTQKESSSSNSSTTEYFENSENTCLTDSCYLDSDISSNTDNSPEKCIHKSLLLDSLCDANLKINENRLGSIDQFEDSLIKQDTISDTNTIYSSKFPCKHWCTCSNNSESDSNGQIQSDMSQKDSNDIGRDRPKVRAVSRNHGNCAISRYEELMKDRNQLATQSSPKSVRVRHTNIVLNSVNILESKVTTRIQALSTTADVEDKIETALTIRNERRRLRQLCKQTSISSTERVGVKEDISSSTVIQNESNQHASTEKVDRRDKENMKTEASGKPPVKEELLLNSSADNITVDKKLHLDTSDEPHVINSENDTDVMVQTDETEFMRTKPYPITDSKAGVFVEIDNLVKSEIPLSTTRCPSGSPVENINDTVEKVFSTSSPRANKTNTVQTKSKKCKKEYDQGSDTLQKAIPPAITVLPDRKHKEFYGAQINKVTNDITNVHIGKCEVSLLSNDTDVTTNTRQCDTDRAQKLSERLPKASAKGMQGYHWILTAL